MTIPDTSHLDPLRKELRRLQTRLPPPPWRKVEAFAVGGLRSIGFDRESELLLVVSSTGRGVIDCQSGRKVARDEGEYDEDESQLEAIGIGPLQDRVLRLSGLHGGGLPNSTQDGWSLEVVTIDWPASAILLLEPFASLYDSLHGRPSRFHSIGTETELRACGFSYSGRSLVVATPSDITIDGRSP